MGEGEANNLLKGLRTVLCRPRRFLGIDVVSEEAHVRLLFRVVPCVGMDAGMEEYA